MGVVEWDLEFRVTRWNPGAERVFGYSTKEALGCHASLIVPVSARKYVDRVWANLLVCKGGERSTNENVTKGGQTILCEWYNTPLVDADGHVIGVASLVEDITEMRRAQEALQKAHDELQTAVKERTAELVKTNEELAIFRRFAEASAQGFSMADMRGHLTYLNPALCQLFGEERPEDALGKRISTYYSQGYLRMRKQEIVPALLQEGYWQGEVTLCSRQGKLTPALQSSFLIRDEDGTPFRLGALTTDITERKRAEDALRQSHDELRAIYDGLRDGYLIADGETRSFVQSNTAMCEMLGYSDEELLSLLVDDIHPPARLGQVLEQFGRLAEGDSRVAGEIPLLRRDGTVFYTDIIANRLDYHGRPCVIGFFRDITERKQANEALEREQEALRHMLHASDHERQLIAYDIHDGLAQQIAGAVMQLEVFDHQRESKPKQAAEAFQAGMTMLRQSHFEARRLINGVRPPILDESGVVAAIAHLIHEPRGWNTPEIEFRSKVTFERLEAVEENAIYRIVQEGLTNACKHSKSKKVRVSLLQRGDRVKVEIRDWGIGFNPGKLHQNRFGLPGIRERARLLGGKCKIRSKSGQGAAIVVELPVVERKTKE
jgi:PAS domain S-box-containing protein